MIKLPRYILLVLICVIGLPTVKADEIKPPYLYYYSRMLGGIIIERADGIDSRHIGADVIPAGMTGIGGPGWSPSGKYFAGYGVQHSLYSIKNTTPIIIDTNGDEVTNWLGGVPTNQIQMEWAPTDENLLLIIGTNNISQTFYWLWDVEAQQLRVDYGTHLGSLNASPIQWDVPNEQLSFYIAPELYNLKPYYITLKFDGTVLRSPVTTEEYVPIPFIPQTDERRNRYTGADVSPQEKYEVLGHLPSILTNIETGIQTELPSHSQGTSCRDYIWNYDETYIITLTGTIVAGGGCGGNVIGVTDNKGELWRELGGCSWGNACVGWLPEQVSLDMLPSGSTYAVQLDPIEIVYTDDIRFGIYEDDVNLRLFCTNLYTMTVSSDRTERTYFLMREDCPYTTQDNSTELGLPIVLAEEMTRNMLATFHEREPYVTIWIPHIDSYKPVLRLNTYGYELEFTEDGQYLRARNVVGWKVFAVADILEQIEVNSP